MKNYWTQWEWRLWLGDPNLGMCQPATRGIWMDALCAMMERSTDRLTGTLEQLAQVCRCPVAAMTAAVDDLQMQDAAEVHRHDAGITIISRKRRRDIELAEKRSASGKKGAKSKWQNDGKQDGKPHGKSGAASDCDCDYPSSSQFVEFCGTCRILPAEAQDLFLQCESRQWHDGANVPIRDWRKYVQRRAAQIEEDRFKKRGQKKQGGITFCP